MKKEILIILLLFNLSLHSQKASLGKADKKYDAFAYIDAIEIYKKLEKKGYKDEKMFQKLANAYYFNSEFEKAENAYRELFAMRPNQNTELLFRYAQSLKSVGKYDEAQIMMEKFNDKAKNDPRAILSKSNQNYLKNIQANSNRFTIKDAGINSEYSDYGSSFIGNELVFTTARDTGTFARRVHKWNNQAFLNLYSAHISQNDSLARPKRFHKGINTKFHESTPVFTKDGKTMYFTRNNYSKKTKGKSRQSIVLLKLYRASLINGKWDNVRELPFNSNEYNTAHPVLSTDEKALYFVSDMPGSFGQSDLYKVAIHEKGTFGKPQNLGPGINTPGRETFPFMSDENELYFASDGHPGLGGLDVFVSSIQPDGSFGEVQNVGEPINSRKDDFAFLLNTKTRTGYFSSNREGGKGSDDIYKFIEIERLNSKQILEGVIKDSQTNEPIANVEIVIYDQKMQKIQVVKTDENGFYRFEPVDNDTKYFIRIDKEEYEKDEIPFEMPKISGVVDLPVTLKKQLLKIEPGTDLAASDVLDISSIYFDLNRSEIHKSAEFELEKIVVVMNQYPTMKVDVRSHTDSRQTHKYNQELSDRRAKATIDWLVKNGISPERLTGRGYGESQLLNKCADGVACTEEEHQKNRRSQFIVIEK